MTRSFRLIVFDWDGTLMDSEARIVGCLEAAIGDLGLAVRSQDELRNIIGLGLREAVAVLYPDHSPQLLEQLTERYRYHFLGDHPAVSGLFAGAEATVAQLAADGYLLAIATGKGRRGLDQVLQQTGMGSYFHTTICADESFSKPHPAMLEEVMSRLDCDPRETIMVGDTEYDMLMARSAGTQAIAVKYGVHPCYRLLTHSPAACLESIDELLTVLANMERRV
jgi:phosphoglycolate phosphatase